MSSTVTKHMYTAYVRNCCILANKRLPNEEILLPKFKSYVLNLGIGCRKISGAEFLEGIQY